ncbi:MAG TPA: 16S rRNA (guanine(527)-N(7))-methyltransferase RsmG [Chloroflexi bacterium]|nr:16S rRNA (guanine(527)-N(7))-methyltransferase RsmG [Chloroflexota bacterium]
MGGVAALSILPADMIQSSPMEATEYSVTTPQEPLPAHGQTGLPLLVEGCQQLGIPLTATAVAAFERYYQELVTWNQRLNLTTIVAYDEVQTKHFLDSLVSLPLLAEELGAPLPLPTLRLLDVGAGAGFPGIPLKLVTPALQLTLMDGTQKKIAFLEHLIRTLELSATKPVHGRAEELGRTTAHRAQYDVVTARAVAPLATLVEYVLPLVRLGGLAVLYKGPSAPEEFMEARRAIKVMGGETVRLAPVTVPFLAERRFILLVKKIAATPAQYPRGQGLARKRPLV